MLWAEGLCIVKGWDKLALLLVLHAVRCGLLLCTVLRSVVVLLWSDLIDPLAKRFHGRARLAHHFWCNVA